MSLSDKFYEGLSAPLPVAGAQMPLDLVPYAGSPIDSLKQHEQKYKQLMRLQRMSDEIAKKYHNEFQEDNDMDKLSFVGSNPISRRAYLLKKIASEEIFDQVSAEDGAAQFMGPPAPSEQAEFGRPTLQGRRPFSSQLAPLDPRFQQVPQQQTDEFEDDQLGQGQQYLSDEEFNKIRQVPQQQVPQQQVPQQQAPKLKPLKSPPSPAIQPIQPPVQVNPYDLKGFGDKVVVPKQAPQQQAPQQQAPAYSQEYNQGKLRFVGKDSQELGDSGDVVRRLSDLGRAVRNAPGSSASSNTANQPSYYDRLMNNLEHYGTRVARGISTGAQMGASKLYDIAKQEGYLADDSFVGRNFNRDTREALNREMADINASLYHAYGGAQNKPGSNIYADRYNNLDLDLQQDGIQNPINNLLDANTFRRDQIEQQMALRKETDQGRRAELERGIADRINNFYGFNVAGGPNRLETGRISDDLDGTAFSRALREAGDNLFTNPKSTVTRAETLQSMLSKDPGMFKALNDRFGQEAAKAGQPLSVYVANQISSGLDPRLALLDEGGKGIADDIYETDDQRATRYENSRRITSDILQNMTPENQAQFIRTVNPMVIQRAEEINQLMDEDPQKALSLVNAMDPEEARYLLDQVSMFSQFISPKTIGRVMNYDDYKISEDDENFFGGLFNFGGSDIVNRARQQVGAGGNIDDLTGDARDRVYGYNSMRDTPRGRFYLAERGTLGDTFFNPETGEVNYELGGDLVDPRGGHGGVYDRLPAEFHQQYRDAVGAENSGLRDDYFLVDDGYLRNYYYNPYSGDRNYEFLYGNQNKFQNKPLPQQFHEQYRKQFNRSPSYRG